MSSATNRRLVIDRAGRTARAAAIASRTSSLHRLRSLILILAGDIRAEVEQFGGADGRIPASQLPTLRAYLEGRLSTFSDRWRALLDEGLHAAASIGARLLKAVGVVGRDAVLIGQVVEQIRLFTAADGLQLSDRVWRVDQTTRNTLRTAVENAVARGESSAQAAQRYLRDGLPMPADVRAGIDAARPATLAQRLSSLLTDDAPGNPTFNLQRLLRTEINRAYTESYVASVAQHPDVIGVKFNLSPLHPRLDICDLYAMANLHGLGVGVYPPGAHPYPAHPQTLSYLTSVFVDEVTDADRAGKQSAFDWLRGRSDADQNQILGSVKKGDAFRAGLLWPTELRMPWRVVAERLGDAP